MALVGAQFVQAVQPVPVGSLQAFAGANAPTGWLLCDGTSYSTSLYPDLFSVLGYTYGGSSGNFNVPDLRGRMPIGAGNDGTAANNATRTRGTKGGDTRSELLYGNLAHLGTVPIYDGVGGSNWRLQAGGSGVTLSSTGGGTTLLKTNNGGTGSGENMPPFLVTNYIIKALPDVPRQGQALGTTPPIVTALPVNPQFGEVVTYAADATNGVYWTLQYDGGGTYPWKFVGGGSLFTQWTAAFSTSSTGWTTDTAFTGFAIPLAGDYLVTSTCLAQNATAFQWWLWRPDGCSYPTSDSSGARVSQGNNGNYENGTRSLRATLTTGTLNAAARVVGSTGTFADRSIAATPVRVAA